MEHLGCETANESVAELRRNYLCVVVVTMVLIILALVASEVAAAAAMTTATIQDSKDQSASTRAGDQANELAELGATLKAAVLSGALSEDDAMGIYKTMASRLRIGAGLGKAERSTGADSSKLDILMLSAPSPQQISALLEPEFLRRDLAVLRDELELDRDQMMIGKVLMGDYLESFNLASLPFVEALSRYRHTTTDQWMVAALERAQIDNADVMVSNSIASLKKLARETKEKEAVANDSSDARGASDTERGTKQAWAQRMLAVTANLDDRLASLRQRVEVELAELEREGTAITGEDLVGLARQLRDVRTQMRADMTESLELITNQQQRGEENRHFEAAIARIQIERLLARGRLGGESMNLWAALTETSRSQQTGRGQANHMDEARAMLREWAPLIADRFHRRSQATIEREIAGLEFQTTRDRIAVANGGSGFDTSQERIAGTLEPFVKAVEREVTASVEARDVLLRLLDQSATYINEVYPDTGISDTYRVAALRRGFPTEMRQRWSQRALAAALQRDDLDDETREVIRLIDAETVAELESIRIDAVGKRIRRDPKLARAQIGARYGREQEKLKYDRELWLGINYKDFESVDDRTQSQLRGLLTSAQFESLPARRRVPTKGQKGGKAKSGGKVDGKTGGKLGGK